MAFTFCEECGTKISEYATFCPQCGFRTTKRNKAALIKSSQPLVTIVSESAQAGIMVNSFLTIAPIRQNQVDLIFGRAENLMQMAPSVIEAIQAMFPAKRLIADLTPEVQKLLRSGALKIMKDKSGELLATLTKQNGAISQQLRLKEISLSPDLMPALNDLTTQMKMAQIMEGIQDIQTQVSQVLVGQQDDRLALFESCQMQLQQAKAISDTRLRTQKYLNILQTATDAKCMLMRSLQRELTFFHSRKSYNGMQKFFDSDAEKHSAEHIANIRIGIAAVTQATGIEAQVYHALDEPDAVLTSMRQYSEFVQENSLDQQETIQYLNSWDSNNDNELPRYLESVCQKILEVSQNRAEALTEETSTDDYKGR